MKRSVYLAVAMLVVAQAASAGLFYSASSTTEGQGQEAGEWLVDGWIDGEKAKIEFRSSGNPVMPAGAYLLTNDGGQNVFMVNPKEGTYSRWDIEAMLQSMNALLNQSGGMMKIQVENPEVEMLAEEDGGEMLGRDTTYYRYRTAYDIKMKIMGMKRAQSTVTNQEVWAVELDEHPAFGLWLRKDPPSMGDSGMDELFRASTEVVKGFPLKMVTESITAGRKGRETKVRSLMEVTELREESIPDTTFELDPDLVETPMPTLVPQGEEGGFRGLLKRGRGDG